MIDWRPRLNKASGNHCQNEFLLLMRSLCKVDLREKNNRAGWIETNRARLPSKSKFSILMRTGAGKGLVASAQYGNEQIVYTGCKAFFGGLSLPLWYSRCK